MEKKEKDKAEELAKNKKNVENVFPVALTRNPKP